MKNIFSTFWYETKGNGLTLEIGRNGEDEGIFFQGDEADDILCAIEESEKWGTTEDVLEQCV